MKDDWRDRDLGTETAQHRGRELPPKMRLSTWINVTEYNFVWEFIQRTILWMWGSISWTGILLYFCRISLISFRSKLPISWWYQPRSLDDASRLTPLIKTGISFMVITVNKKTITLNGEKYWHQQTKSVFTKILMSSDFIEATIKRIRARTTSLPSPSN